MYTNEQVLNIFYLLKLSYSLSRLYEPDGAENNLNNHEPGKYPLPYQHFSVSSKPVQGNFDLLSFIPSFVLHHTQHIIITGMVSSNDHLIVGGRNSIQGYNWDQLILSKPSQSQEPSWCVDLHLPTYV